MIYGDQADSPDALLPDILAIKQSGNLYVYCANDPVFHVDPTGRVTYAAGGDVAAAFVLRLGVTGQFVVDDDGNVGFLVSGAVGAGTPSASVAAVTTVTFADTIFDLEGKGKSIGASGSLGFDYVDGTARDNSTVRGYQVSKGVSATPIEAHWDTTKTVVYSLNHMPEWFKNDVRQAVYSSVLVSGVGLANEAAGLAGLL